MNGFNLSDIQDAKLGGTQLSAIYLGSSKLWPTAFDYSQEYLTIESLADNNTISWWLSDGNYGTNKYISYSTDKTNWTSVSSHYTSPGNTITTLNTGDKIYLKGSNNQYANSTAYCKFNTTGAYKVYGNIISLVNNGNFNNNPSISTYAFTGLFRNSLITDVSNLILPSTILTSYCYYNMFKGCSSLTTTPKLPATTLADSCYQSMFQECTSLTTAPELSATTLADSCYREMFKGCSSLTTAPKLPATTLVPNCYRAMFSGCAFTDAPELSATTLTDYCYYYMFENCTSLTAAPVLPATTLKQYCYGGMFKGCSSLTTAPELPATTLVNYCYQKMFYGCTSLNYIKCLATNISATPSHHSWVYKVAATGTFVKPSSMTSWGTGTSGIPQNWTVVNI